MPRPATAATWAEGMVEFGLAGASLWADVPLPTSQCTYGNELDLIVRWAIIKQWFLLGVAGRAWSGDVIQAQTQGSAQPWSTVQLSLFWAF